MCDMVEELPSPWLIKVNINVNILSDLCTIQEDILVI